MNRTHMLLHFLTLTLIAILCLIIISLTATAYVPSQEYKGVIIKFYHDDINQTHAYQQLDRIPEEYFKGLHHISYNLASSMWCGGKLGYYVPNNGIKLCTLRISTLIHELAHHNQILAGDELHLGYSHSGRFPQYKINITNEVV